MPAGLLIGALSWFASHLIVITLLGFVLAGLWVFGLIGSAPPGPAQGSSAASTTQVERPPVADPGGERDTSGAVQAPARERVVEDDRSDQARKDPGVPTRQPRMIGGSLPIYDVRPRLSDAPPHGPADGFRPPSEMPQDAAQPMSREQGFQRARRAFWNGDFEAAESAYMDLIAEHPDDPDAYGELGNLYESMGKPELAADAYFEAGSWLKRRGEIKKLEHVIEFLSKKGDERVQSLEQGVR